MAPSFAAKIAGFLVRPAETFHAVRHEPVADAAVYYLLLLAVMSILAGVMVSLGFSVMDGSALGISTGPEDGLMSFVWALAFTCAWGLFTLVIWAIVLQIGANSLGGRGEFADAFRVAVYAQTPYLLFGWIPVVGWLLSQLWAVALTVIGVQKLYAVDAGKAVAVAVVALVLYLTVAWVLGLFGLAVASGLADLLGLLG
ncbi:MAG: YIP1 family protein [Methanospirillum sp.]|nr:YIP1 family protein [Methanospirillum sp.]